MFKVQEAGSDQRVNLARSSDTGLQSQLLSSSEGQAGQPHDKNLPGLQRGFKASMGNSVQLYLKIQSKQKSEHVTQ